MSPGAAEPYVDRHVDSLDAAIGTSHGKANRHRCDAPVLDHDHGRIAPRLDRSDRLVQRPRLVEPRRPEPRQVLPRDVTHGIEEVVRVRMLANPSSTVFPI